MLQVNPSAALVIPALDPPPALAALLGQLLPRWQGPAVVVDDGSGKASQPVLARAAQLGATVLHHGQNRGKGAALKTAFRYCLAAWPDLPGCVTADADGQHTAGDILRIAGALRRSPGSLVLGCRDFSAPDVPRKSRLGNRLTCAALALLGGVRLSDTQTGLRGIPAALLPQLVQLPGDRYEFETAMLLAARRAGIPFVELPVATVYTDGNRGSHFRPVRDTLRIARVVAQAPAAQAGRFAASSLACSGLDLALFTLLAGLLRPVTPWYVAAATAGARVVSAGCNFAVNRRLVFRPKAQPARTAGAGLRYAALCLAQAAASAALTTGLSALLPLPAAICKIPVDLALFLVSFALQRSWVFAPAAGKEDLP